MLQSLLLILVICIGLFVITAIFSLAFIAGKSDEQLGYKE